MPNDQTKIDWLELECARLRKDLRTYMNAANEEAKFATDLKAECDQLRAELAALRAPVERQAPEEPTNEMLDAGGHAVRRVYSKRDHDRKPGEVMCAYIYRAMLSAAPSAPGSTKNG